MKFTDTHTHLYDEQFDKDRDQMMNTALKAGVKKMFIPNCDSSTISGMLSIADKWPEHCFPMIGLHPCYVKDNYEEELELVRQWLKKRTFYGIGEVGLDKYWDLSHIEQQVIAFETQIDLALEYDLPVIIHSREATPHCIDIVRSKQNGTLRGIFHCFSGNPEEAKQIIELNFMLGIGGVVTYKKTNLPEIIAEAGLEHIVLETDAPYLAPVPYRGKRNESSYIPLIAERIAALLDVPIQEVAATTTANAEKVFSNRR